MSKNFSVKNETSDFYPKIVLGLFVKDKDGKYKDDYYSGKDIKITINKTDTIKFLAVQVIVNGRRLLFATKSKDVAELSDLTKTLEVVIRLDKIIVKHTGFVFENNVIYEDCLISTNCISDKSILQNEKGQNVSYSSRYVSPNLPARESFVNFKDLTDDSTMIIVYYILCIVFMLSTVYLLWLRDGKKIKLVSGLIILLLIVVVVHFIYKKMKN